MCVYCYCGDWIFQNRPPWKPTEYPLWPKSVPMPISPYAPLPMDVDQLKKLQDLLKRVKDLEDRLGCECDPNKDADYINLLEKRIEYLEKQNKGG